MRLAPSPSRKPNHLADQGTQDFNSEFLQLKWQESFETGNPEIDRIHRKLIVDCNILLAMIANSSSWAMIVSRARWVIEDCVGHFRLEESILEKSEFSRLDEHKVEHARLEAEMRSTLARMETGEEAFVDRFEHARWLGALLINAIVRNDLDFRSHILNEQGR